MVPDASHGERTGRFTHSEEAVRAGGDQDLAEGGEEAEEEEGGEEIEEAESDGDDGVDADGLPQTISGVAGCTTEGFEESQIVQPTTAQLPLDNLELFRRISDT